MPEIHVNITAIIVAVLANLIFGYLWYTPLFGKIWAREMGFTKGEKESTSVMVKGMFLMIIGNILLAWVFAHNIAAWNPVTWGLPQSELSSVSNALMAAVLTWLGFFVPQDLSTVGWEKKSWTLFFINTGYHFFSMLILAMILVHM